MLLACSLIPHPSSLLASETGSIIAPGGGEVKFTSADEVKTLPNGEIVLVYTNAAATDASFEFQGLTSARILAVGGGGGGGGIYCQATAGGKSPYSGGGGGGAGGFVELTNLYNAATYLVNVGTGGVAGVGSSATTKAKSDFTGENGSDTFITTNGIELVRALGGGGGGGQRAGLNGASGGGGAYQPSSTETAGGAALQGFAGGAGKAGTRGGGGGGAGAPGLAGNAAELPGTGGDGVQSDISGTPTYYAGGGGGGNSDKNVTGQAFGIAGGQGGGGQGGNGRSPAAPTETTPGGDAQPGVDGTGGGGGGAGKNTTTAAGKGGTGTVVVRIAASLSGGLEKPADVQVRYDGEFHSIVQPSAFMEIVSGVNGGTAVGTYSVLVRPVHTTWKDGSTDPKVVSLVIYDESSLPETTVEVTGAPVTFVGADSYSWIDNGDGTKDLLVKFLHAGSYTFPGSTSARILAVGGGGGGGGIYCQATAGGKSPYSGGGGGGAGGFVELTNLYSEATYLVNVGTGGVAGVGSSATTKAKDDFSGKNGGDTFITTNGIELVRALGGGGGGGQRAGLEGASGGGGAYQPSSTETAGGAALQGFAGGAGKAGTRGGGGGGAGAPGLAGNAAELPGTGGDGVQSSITNANNAAQSTWAWFAGGGGGGNSDKTVTGQAFGIAGGKGGGGQGGNGRSPAAPTETTPGGDAKPGVDGTGGGGGGAGKNTTTAAGKGGSGVVYVRISSAMRGEFKKPDPLMEVTYDRNAHTSIANTVFYDVTGDNIGTNAGTYVATAKLKPGVVWPGGGTEDAEVKMIIAKRPVTVTELRIDGWTYGDEETPEPSCTVDPEWAVLSYEWRVKSEEVGGWKPWSEGKPEHAGTYELRVRLSDEENYEFAAGGDPGSVEFTVRKLPVTVTELRIRDWEVGAPATIPHCTVSPEWMTKLMHYEWKAKVEGEGEQWKDWSLTKPTELGAYLLRAMPPDEADYALTPESDPPFAFSIVKGLGGLFTDYVEIEIAGYAGETLVNWPYRIDLSEQHPVGFLYERAPVYGEHMAFTDATGDNILPYEVKSWTTNGTSVIYVKIPRIGSEKQKIRLYWNERPGADIPKYDPEAVWTDHDEEEAQKLDPPQPGMSFPTPVSQDGRFVNYWLRHAELDPDFWDAANPPANPLKSNAVLAYGQTLRVWENLVTGAAVTNVVTTSSPTEVPTTLGGNFRIRYFQGDDIDHEYVSPSTNVDYSVTADMPLPDLKGNAKSLTLSGRVMLANDDWLGGDTPTNGLAVTDQSYWQEHVVETNATTHATVTNDVFWTHGGEEHGTYASSTIVTHMLPGTEHRLCFMDGGQLNTLWRLKDVIIGNTIRDDRSLYSYQCILPWSTTGLGITSYADYPKQGDMLEAGNLILRNKAGAAVYSPCYTNGIGTIYFDIVNSNNTDAGDPYYQVVVEVLSTTSFGGVEPTDANVALPNAKTVEEEVGKPTAEQWESREMLVLFRDGAGAKLKVDAEKVREFAPAVKDDRSTSSFYRICAKVNCREACRFRIRRPARNEDRNFDNGSLILVDNILVSYPQMKAEMKPDGMFEQKETTKQVLGQENAFIPPFPSVTDGAIVGRGVADCEVSAVTNLNPAGLIARSKMWYRWRYLDQAFDPPDKSWRPVVLKPGDDFVAREALKLPRTEGDVEFWFENDVNAPYYAYHDYSGTELGLKGEKGDLYTEQVTVSTNGYDNPWFVRLRAGRSDLEGFRVLAKTAANAKPQEVEMNLVGNGLWRGYYQTPNAVDGGDGKGLYVRFEARNRQTSGASGFATNTTFYTLENDLRELMVPAALHEWTVDPSNQWSRVVCDAQTGYILFQITEENLAATVVHADYQNFNMWNDANSDARVSAAGTPPFKGTSTEEKSRTGASSRTREVKERFGWWHASQATNDLWTESFKVSVEEMQKKGGQFEAFEPFSENVSPNGFTVGPGQWVTGAYRDYNSGEALQMEGRGKGYIQFVNAAETPRGVESITFRPRLAQAIEFGDFTYYDGDKLALTNYTFYCRAAYDVAERKSFVGNASLSLVACYRAGEGCYELRVEQEGADIQSGVLLGPKDSQRLSLYKWRYDDGTGEILPVRLGTMTVTQSGMLTTKGEDGNYALLFISAKDTGAATEITAGVSTGVAAIDSTTSPNCRWVAYIDSGAKYGKRIRNGGYGVLSANCPARFRYLKQKFAAQKCPTSTKDTWYNDSSASTFSIPSVTESKSCWQDIQNESWAVQQRRAKLLDGNDPVTFGFQPAPASNTVYVYTAPTGSTAFDTKNPLKQVTISNFGSVDAITIPLHSLNDCSVKIAPGGTAKSARNDIVVDDIEIRQWRGESFDDKEGQKYFPEIDWGSPTNFVFTQGWIWSNVTTKATSVELSAKRSLPTVATSIRTPLFDGIENTDGTVRGLGLGMFGFTYTNAQQNARLLLQVCTNRVDITNLRTWSKSVDPSIWDTVETYDFSKPPYSEQRDSGTILHYFGWHGVKGVIRLVVDPKLVESVTNVTDTAKFGSVTVTEAVCRDEPDLDRFAWWGWNLQTTGLDGRLGLWDADRDDALAAGQAFALNNSVEADLAEDKKLYPAHLPFLQSPTFATNTVGEVSFRARKYHPEDEDCRVTLYGAVDGTKALDDWNGWTPLKYWTITTNLYETCTYKAAQGQAYCAFRFVVTGVPKVEEGGRMQPATPQEKPPAADPVKRVLIDEVTVMETIAARVAFRNVMAFRSWLENARAVTSAAKAEQPLVGEAWGVQGELVKAQLPEEIDLSKATVRLWWYEGKAPWGFAKWRDLPGAKNALLSKADDNPSVWRSSYLTCPQAVVPPSVEATTVQYMLEVKWHMKDEDRTEQTTYLSSADWSTPAWYRPIDFNADLGAAGGGFSAYTILDTVAPGWAWFNEVNLFGTYDDASMKNSDADYQYLEIASPVEADLTGWSVRMLAPASRGVTTNTVALFGDQGLEGLKKDNLGQASGMVFRVIASLPTQKAKKLDRAKGEIDGTWSFPNPTTTFMATGEISWSDSFGIQLVRPSGVVEHEIVTIGYNYWKEHTSYPELYDPSNTVVTLNERMNRTDFQYVGDDDGVYLLKGREETGALSVYDSRGEISNFWDKAMVHTPGRINAYADGRVQKLSPDHPTPAGTSVLLYANVGDEGNIEQFDAEGRATTNMLLIILKKGSKEGTNLVYRTAPWYDLGLVTTNDAPYLESPVSLGDGLWSLNYGRGASNNLTIVAHAGVCEKLRDLGVDEQNRYTPAIMDWFGRGKNRDGTFVWPDSGGEVYLADFRDLGFNFVTNLSVTDMYWLDICPTITNQALVGGLYEPSPTLAKSRRNLAKGPLLRSVVHPDPYPDPDHAITNRRMNVFMMITNMNEQAGTGPYTWREAYAPYVTQGVDYERSSWEYRDEGRGAEAWDGPSFKIAGLLANGLTSQGNPKNWMPLRWFVFDKDSFYGPDDPECQPPNGSKPFTSEVEVEDPADPGTPGYDYWWTWVRDKNGGVWPNIFFRWELNERQYLYEVEILKKNNWFED